QPDALVAGRGRHLPAVTSPASPAPPAPQSARLRQERLWSLAQHPPKNVGGVPTTTINPDSGLQRSAPTSTGSLARSTPNAFRTPSATSRARASRPAVVAPPGLTSARVCLAEIRGPSGAVPPG